MGEQGPGVLLAWEHGPPSAKLRRLQQPRSGSQQKATTWPAPEAWQSPMLQNAPGQSMCRTGP